MKLVSNITHFLDGPVENLQRGLPNPAMGRTEHVLTEIDALARNNLLMYCSSVLIQKYFTGAQ